MLAGAQDVRCAAGRSLRRPLRTLIFLMLPLLMASNASAADWLFTPFIGGTFGTNTTFLLLETGATDTTQLIFGGSAALLSRGIFGVEGDFSYAPRFFENDNRAGNITGSNATTLTGNVIVAVPMSVTRESLRPYAIGGAGLMHAAAKDALLDVFTFNESFAGMDFGGGALGLISPRTGFRFEVRHFRSFERSTKLLTGEDGPKLSFWRATVGVIFRLPD